jgi:hypothetical protein
MAAIALGLTMTVAGCAAHQRPDAAATKQRIEKTNQMADLVDYPLGKPTAKMSPSLAKKLAATAKGISGPLK